jgi:glutaredoxin 3
MQAIVHERDRRRRDMATKRKVEVFSAGCPTCKEAVETVKKAACSSCEVIVLDMNDTGVAKRAKALGVGSVPAVAIDGKLAECCTGRGINMQVLRAAGLGMSLPKRSPLPC